MANDKKITVDQLRDFAQRADDKFIDEDELQARLDGSGSGVGGYSVSLSTSWTEQTNGTYAQTVSVAGVTADNQVIVDCALSGADINADIAVLEAWGYVNRCSQAVGSLTFYCYGDVPTVAIPLNVVVAG